LRPPHEQGKNIESYHLVSVVSVHQTAINNYKFDVLMDYAPITPKPDDNG